jgi:hypothetical protein
MSLTPDQLQRKYPENTKISVPPLEQGVGRVVLYELLREMYGSDMVEHATEHSPSLMLIEGSTEVA